MLELSFTRVGVRPGRLLRLQVPLRQRTPVVLAVTRLVASETPRPRQAAPLCGRTPSPRTRISAWRRRLPRCQQVPDLGPARAAAHDVPPLPAAGVAAAAAAARARWQAGHGPPAPRPSRRAAAPTRASWRAAAARARAPPAPRPASPASAPGTRPAAAPACPAAGASRRSARREAQVVDLAQWWAKRGGGLADVSISESTPLPRTMMAPAPSAPATPTQKPRRCHLLRLAQISMMPIAAHAEALCTQLRTGTRRANPPAWGLTPAPVIATSLSGGTRSRDAVTCASALPSPFPPCLPACCVRSNANHQCPCPAASAPQLGSRAPVSDGAPCVVQMHRHAAATPHHSAIARTRPAVSRAHCLQAGPARQ